MMGWGRSFRRWLVPLAGLFALLAFAAMAAAPAHADDEAEGRRRWKRGQDLYSKGRFLEAATEFEAGYAAAPRTAFLVNIGHSYRRGGELKKARQAYTKLLELEPSYPGRAEIEEFIRTIDDALLLPTPEVPSPTRPGATSGPKPPPRAAPPPAAPPPQPTPEMLAAEVASPEERSEGAITGRAWFWVAAVTVLVAGGVAAALLLKTDPACPADGCFVEMRPSEMK